MQIEKKWNRVGKASRIQSGTADSAELPMLIMVLVLDNCCDYGRALDTVAQCSRLS